VQAVADQLVGRDVGPDLARLGAGGEQAGDQVLKLLPRPGDVLAAVQQRYRQLGAVVLAWSSAIRAARAYQRSRASALRTLRVGARCRQAGARAPLDGAS